MTKNGKKCPKEFTEVASLIYRLKLPDLDPASHLEM